MRTLLSVFFCCSLVGALAAGDFSVVINEINYHPLPAGDYAPGLLKWVELYNRSGGPVDISGWRFSEGIEFTFPPETILPGGGYLVVCRNKDAFRAVWGEAPATGNFGLNLAKGGERLTLLNREGFVVDSVYYDDRSPWPKEADGRGATLELVDPDLENDDGRNWAASPLVGGTPGRANSSLRETVDLVAGGSRWRFWKGTEDPPGASGEWLGAGYDDSLWLQGETPIGYGSEEAVLTVLEDMQDGYTTVFARVSFDVPAPDSYENLILTVDFDDGFVAYLNGEEAARMFLDGGEIPGRGATASEAHESGLPVRWRLPASLLVPGENVLALVGANESAGSADFVLSAALTGVKRTAFEPEARISITEAGLTGGEKWIELHNESASPVDLGDYFLAADFARLPAGRLSGVLESDGYAVFTREDLPFSEGALSLILWGVSDEKGLYTVGEGDDEPPFREGVRIGKGLAIKLIFCAWI